jgi:alpha-mannosidase
LYRDRPRRWEAWDIDQAYEASPIALPKPCSVDLVEQSELHAVIEVKRSIGASSTAVQRYTMHAGSGVLSVELTVQWRESKRLLRCGFDTDIRAVDAIFGIQFGHIRRATHRNTPFDEARFEVPGHRWMDISEPGRGLAVLDQGIFGKSAHGGQLGLSLLRGTTFPDPHADQGTHVLRWALMPHHGQPLEAGVVAEAEVFSGRGVQFGVAQSPPPFTIDVSKHAAIEIAACKGAQDDRGRVLRLVELHGAHGMAVLQWPKAVNVTATDLHEQPIASEAVAHAGDRTQVTIRPFGVITLRIEDIT